MRSFHSKSRYVVIAAALLGIYILAYYALLISPIDETSFPHTGKGWDDPIPPRARYSMGGVAVESVFSVIHYVDKTLIRPDVWKW